MARIMIREGEDARDLGRIYSSVVQEVLLYGSETWVMTLPIGRILGGFHHRVACRLTGRQNHRRRYGGWVYTLLAEDMEEAGLQELETYVYHRQITDAQFIVNRPIMDLCLAAKRHQGSWVEKRWWKQDSLDLEGMQTEAQEAERTEGEEDTDRTVMDMD